MGGQGIKIGPRETENSSKFWANNKIFISYRPKFIQAAQIFARPMRGSPTDYPRQFVTEQYTIKAKKKVTFYLIVLGTSYNAHGTRTLLLLLLYMYTCIIYFDTSYIYLSNKLI